VGLHPAKFANFFFDLRFSSCPCHYFFMPYTEIYDKCICNVKYFVQFYMSVCITECLFTKASISFSRTISIFFSKCFLKSQFPIPIKCTFFLLRFFVLIAHALFLFCVQDQKFCYFNVTLFSCVVISLFISWNICKDANYFLLNMKRKIQLCFPDLYQYCCISINCITWQVNIEWKVKFISVIFRAADIYKRLRK
jgi:hypothetical protein